MQLLSDYLCLCKSLRKFMQVVMQGYASLCNLRICIGVTSCLCKLGYKLLRVVYALYAFLHT